MDSAQFQQRMQRIEELIAAIQEHANPVVRASAVELVRALLDVHRAGLEQILEQADRALVDEFIANDLVSRLLLLHGLHPVDLPTRIHQALDQAQAPLRAHGAEAELQQATHEVVVLRVRGGTDRVHRLLEQAILAAAPDVLRLEFVNADHRDSRLVSLPLIGES